MTWDDDDTLYELGARYDYQREAYGDACPRHPEVLRGGADCWKCESEMADETAPAPADIGDVSQCAHCGKTGHITTACPDTAAARCPECGQFLGDYGTCVTVGCGGGDDIPF